MTHQLIYSFKHNDVVRAAENGHQLKGTNILSIRAAWPPGHVRFY